MIAIDVDAGLVWLGLNGAWHTGAPGAGNNGVLDFFAAEGPLTASAPYMIVLSSAAGTTDTIIQPSQASHPTPPGFAYWVD